jgi:hypothetical protein
LLLGCIGNLLGPEELIALLRARQSGVDSVGYGGEIDPEAWTRAIEFRGMIEAQNAKGESRD